MSSDTLSHVLRAVRFRGAVFFDVEGRPPWVAEAPPSRELAPAIMPDAEHLIEFHGVVRGACWAARMGEPAVRLEAGDVVLFPHGDAHVMSSAPGLRAQQVDPSPPLPPTLDRLPLPLSVDAAGVSRPRAGDPHPASTHLVCGFLGLDARPFNPLLDALPRLLTLQDAAASPSWVGALLASAVAESRGRRAGSEAMLARMSEVLFVEAVRRHVESLPADRAGWLAAIRDPAVGQALARLHADPARPWTLESLCEVARLSRSAFHERFVHLVGLPPMQYLTRWRMQLASRLLRDTTLKVVRIALDVGYESEAAFVRAFRREVGVAPGAWRRSSNGAHDATSSAGSG